MLSNQRPSVGCIAMHVLAAGLPDAQKVKRSPTGEPAAPPVQNRVSGSIPIAGHTQPLTVVRKFPPSHAVAVSIDRMARFSSRLSMRASDRFLAAHVACALAQVFVAPAPPS